MPCRTSSLMLAAALLLPLAACTPPEGAAVTSCTTTAQLGVQNPARDCVLRVDRFTGGASASFSADGPSFYRHYEAQAEFTVERGSVLVRVLGSHDPVQFLVEPGRPWKGRIVARLGRQDRRFRIAMEPQGDAAGLQATVRHRKVTRSMLSPPEVLPQG